MRRLRPAELALATACLIWPLAGQYTITTVAGGGVPNNIPGVNGSLLAFSVVTDNSGNVYIGASYAVFKLSASGLLTLVAGTGSLGPLGDGVPATSAGIVTAGALAVDNDGNLFILDTGARVLRKVSRATGLIATVAQFQLGGNPGQRIALDGAGNLYLVGLLGAQVSKVALATAQVTVVAGTGASGFSGDGSPALNARLSSSPEGVALDNAGNLYIADSGNNRIRRVDAATGIITTVAGTGQGGFSGDGGPASEAQLSNPRGLAFDRAGNLYVADAFNYRIRKIAAGTGVITTIAGSGTSGSSGDGGPALNAQLTAPGPVAVDAAGNIYITGGQGFFGDTNVRKIASGTGIITTIAGTGDPSFSGDGGSATLAQLSKPTGVALDPGGNLYVVDNGNFRVRRIDARTGVIATVAGKGPSPGRSGDGGPATQAGLFDPWAVAVDQTGNLYISEASGAKVRKVAASGGTITTVAGTGLRGFSGDGGLATAAQLSDVHGIALDRAGNLYIADSSNGRIRKVDAVTGIISTVAGGGSAGDGAPATTSGLNGPWGVALDGSGNIYIADTFSNRVRRVDATSGIITTIAGTGAQGSIGDGGPATAAQLFGPSSVAVDSAGGVYIADFQNELIRMVTPTGVITTIAGTRTGCCIFYTGPATAAQMNFPFGVALDTAGNVYIASGLYNRVQVLTKEIGTAVVAVTSGASNVPGSIAPGEILVMYGSQIGPPQLAQLHINDAGLVDTQLAGTRVLFNGTPAPIVYALSNQVAAIVPYEVTGPIAQLVVQYQGQASSVFGVPAASSAPALFTLDSTGKGQAAAVNQNGSINTPSTPAPIGSTISLYATGEGQTSPSGVDGKLGTDPLPHPVLPLSVTIGGQTAQVQYEGGAPGEVAGVMQVNVQIPSGIQPGNAVPVVLKVGNASSPSGVTIAVSGN
ncbi:MAG TPA: hypothetical protein VEU11_05835 [Terriglobales bacterium]|nr:hypothetical protein [Terriglobales bacterium]